MKDHIKIGLIGFGNIGSAVVRYFLEHRELIVRRTNTDVRLAGIADVDITSPRDITVDPALLTTDAHNLLDDPDIDIIIELIGGLEPARSFVVKALSSGKSVVTANKALLATCGAELIALARKNNVQLRFEASVGAGIPIISALQQALAANRIKAIYGIINGTANYILTSMCMNGQEFDVCLKDAQQKGYAEPDPTYDIEGIDTAHKIAVLASLAFKQDIRIDDVSVEGISRIEHTDILYADELGYSIKLLGVARLDDQQQVQIFVHPTLVSRKSLLASVNGVYNGIMIEGDPVGKQLYYGEGAGKGSTSSAVLGDVISIVRWLGFPECKLGTIPLTEKEVPNIPVGFKNIKRMEDLELPYYFRFSVLDKTGTMARISKVLAEHDISIAAMIQKTINPMHYATLILVAHRAKNSNVIKAVDEITRLEICEKRPLLLSVLEW